MSCVLLVIEPAGINVIKELGVLFNGYVQGHSIRPPNNNKPRKQSVCSKKNLQGFVWIGEHLDYREVPNVLPKDVKVEYFVAGTEEKQGSWQFNG